MEEMDGGKMRKMSQTRHNEWDCHRTADQLGGFFRGQFNGAAYMALYGIHGVFRFGT